MWITLLDLTHIKVRVKFLSSPISVLSEHTTSSLGRRFFPYHYQIVVILHSDALRVVMKFLGFLAGF